jgi:tetratricopeptide (TPR) repeat protein
VGIHTSEQIERTLEGLRIALVGKLTSMSRGRAEELIRDHGGQAIDRVDADAEFVVVGDESPDAAEIVADEDVFNDAARVAWQDGRLQVIRESEFWARIGLVDSGPGINRFYTPVMLAELVRVPVQAIRHWHRKDRLRSAHEVGRLAYFDFEEVRVARRLAELLSAGCTVSQIDRKLDELARSLPNLERPLAEASVVVVGRRLYLRRGDALTEPSGQLLIDFESVRDGASDAVESVTPVTIPISSGDLGTQADAWDPDRLASSFGISDLRSLADDFEESGQPERAIEVYRALLMSGRFTAEDHFSLAELLYRNGDPAAARERYYAAIELDEEYVEARANLGCVLAEGGEHALAEAAFRGALKYHPDFADAHYHLARLLDATGQSAEASRHWQRFLELAPASPWAEEALDRTGRRLSP